MFSFEDEQRKLFQQDAETDSFIFPFYFFKYPRIKIDIDEKHTGQIIYILIGSYCYYFSFDEIIYNYKEVI